MRWLSRLETNQRLALVAFVLGLVALGARPAPGPVAAIDPRELAIAVQRGADQVRPSELAGWIIEGRGDYRLLDLRNAEDYGTYHVPGAESVPLATLPGADISRTEKVVLYSQDGLRASQAWFLLRAQGVRAAYILAGGLDAWKREVLYPQLREPTTADAREANARLSAVSRHFGGAPVSEASDTEPAAPAATLPPPPPPVKAAAPAAVKKKEGC